MRSKSIHLALSAALWLGVMAIGPAHAGGWSGGQSHQLRAAFNKGYTLTPLWDHLNSR